MASTRRPGTVLASRNTLRNSQNDTPLNRPVSSLVQIRIEPICKNGPMVRKAVDSTTMRSVGYQAQRRILEIEFDSGAVYQVSGVPAMIYQELLRAESKGRYFNSEIRDVYPYVQVSQVGRG